MAASRALPFWGESPGGDGWDALILGGKTWPGVVTISGSGVARRIDTKKAKGKDGATIKDNGMDLAKINIELTIWTKAQWAEVNDLLPSIHPKRKGGPREPLEIINPQANFLGIKTIYINKIAIPKLDKSSDVMTLTFSAIEFVPRPKPVKKAAGGTGKNKPGVADPLDALVNKGIALAETIGGAVVDVISEAFDFGQNDP